MHRTHLFLIAAIVLAALGTRGQAAAVFFQAGKPAVNVLTETSPDGTTLLAFDAEEAASNERHAWGQSFTVPVGPAWQVGAVSVQHQANSAADSDARLKLALFDYVQATFDGDAWGTYSDPFAGASTNVIYTEVFDFPTGAANDDWIVFDLTTPQDLAPGEYGFAIWLSNPAGGATSGGSLTLRNSSSDIYFGGQRLRIRGDSGNSLPGGELNFVIQADDPGADVLYARFDFEETAGPDLVDALGNTTATVDASAVFAEAGVTSKALGFAGSTAMTVAYRAQLNAAQEFSVGFWVNPGGGFPGGDFRLFVDASATGDAITQGYRVMTKNNADDNNIRFLLKTAGGNVDITHPEELQAGVWYYVAARYKHDDQARLTVMPFGLEVDLAAIDAATVSAPALGTVSYSSNNDVIVGNNTTGGAGLIGTMDQLRFYAGMITDATIKTAYDEAAVSLSDFVIGSVAALPTINHAGGIYGIELQSTDFWNDRDNGVFTDRSILAGDFHLETQVSALAAPPHPWAKAGIMVRETTDSQSRAAGVYFTSERGAVFQSRRYEQALTSRVVEESLGSTGSVRLIRVGDGFYGAASEDGRRWVSLGRYTWETMPAELTAGLGVASQYNAPLQAQLAELVERDLATETGIYDLTLVDDGAGTDLRSFFQGDVLDVDYYSSGLSVRAEVASACVQSVVFNVDGSPVATDDSAPFAVDLTSLADGAHNLEAIPYDGAGGTGNAFDSIYVEFDVNRGAPATPPNLVYIFCDDLGYADCGFNGSQDVFTPNLDRLAQDGVRCTSGYVTAPQCGPSRAGIVSGMHQTRFAYLDNSSHRGLPIQQVAPVASEILKTLGYTTAMIGKWHVEQNESKFAYAIAADERNVLPWYRGFDYTYAMDGGSCHYFPYRPDGTAWLTTRDYEYRNLEVFEGTQTVSYLDLSTDTYQTTEFTERAIQFIDRNSTAPFFVYLSYNAPHTPVTPSDEEKAANSHIADSARRNLAGAMTGVDREVGRLMDYLTTTGLVDNTIVFFFSDNGGPTASNRSYNDPFIGFKGDVLEGGTRVPFLISWPGQIPRNRDFHAPIFSFDYVTMLLDLLGRPIPDYLDGEAILPDLQGKTSTLDQVPRFVMWRTGYNTCRLGDYKKITQPGGAVSGAYAGHFDIEENIREDLAFAPIGQAIIDQLDALMDAHAAEATDPDNQDFWFTVPAESSAHWSLLN